jgi:hypothetical protein
MSVGEHNPSRRALLGAAVALPLIGGLGAGTARPLHHRRTGDGPPPRSGEDLRWGRALVRYERAAAALAEVERRTAGAPWEEQDAVEEEYGDALDALYRALRRLLRVAAPDLPALAVKIELAIDHEVATLNGGEACLETVRRDALRLCSGQARRMAAVNGDSYE